MAHDDPSGAAVTDDQAGRERAAYAEIASAFTEVGVPEYAYPTPEQYADAWDTLSRDARLILAERHLEASSTALRCTVGNHLPRLEQWELSPLLRIPAPVKMLRETLCVAQAAIGATALHPDAKMNHIGRLDSLVAECDRHRPLGPDGTHGDLHTATCGCEDR